MTERTGHGGRWLIIFRCRGLEIHRISEEPPEIPGDALAYAIVEGVIEEAVYRSPESTEAASAAAKTPAIGEAKAPRPRGHHRRGGLVPVVLDQMYRGFADILAGKLDYVEAHEVVGRGLKSTLAKGDRVYLEPAESDYDVIKLAERLAGEKGLSVLVTGDKKLAEQARLKPGVRVLYMPPGEYPGKESMVEALIGEIERVKREATGQDKNPRDGTS